jgi:hypothetical protein
LGEKIDGVYACILGPYGEGNYPLYVPDWINIGHCHEGYWCGDPHARRAFREAMRAKYRDIAALNRAWATQYESFDDLQPPRQATIDTLRIHPDLFVTPGDQVYEGMLAGENSRPGDLDVNVTKEKKLTNMRTTASDENVILEPPRQITLEYALEYIEEDELIEVTPKNIRLRKRVLTANDRKKAARAARVADAS